MIYDNLAHPFATTGAIARLKEELDTYGKLVIGFDFDNTIFDFHVTYLIFLFYPQIINRM